MKIHEKLMTNYTNFCSRLSLLLQIAKHCLNLDKARGYWLIAFATAAPMLDLASSAIYGAFLNNLQNRLSIGGATATIFALGLINYFGFPTLRAIFNEERSAKRALSKLVVDKELDIQMARKLSDRDPAQFDSKEFMGIFQRVKDAGNYPLTNAYFDTFEILDRVIGLLLRIAVVASIGWWLALVLCLATLPRLFVGIGFGGWAFSIWSASSDIRRSHSDIYFRFTSGLEIFGMKLLGIRDHLLGRSEQLYNSFHEEQITKAKKQKRQEIGIRALEDVVYCGCVMHLLAQLLDGSFKLGDFTFYVGSVGMIQGSLNSIASRWISISGSLHHVKDYFDLHATPNLLTQNKSAVELTRDEIPQIKFLDVSFSYPNSPSQKVLQRLNLTIAPKEQVAIVGKNGAGKTTLIQLLLRYYDPSEGQILIGDKDLRDISLPSWYQLLGVFPSGNSTFAWSVRQNIEIGDLGKKPNLMAVQKAAEDMMAHSFIDKLPLKYDQIIGKSFKDGVDFSAGERQRLALARHRFRDPKFYILDEPTSALDAAAEKQLFEKILTMLTDSTLLYVSHRFSTVRHAKRIVVVNSGAICEDGDHESLSRAGGIYAELFDAQAAGYK